MEIAAEIDPRIAGPERIQRIDFHGRVADDLEQLLVAPDVAGKRRDIEIPDEQGGQGERLGPARHPLDEIELLPEFGIERAIGEDRKSTRLNSRPYCPSRM